jgi:outer membrane protein TolC
MMNLKRLIVAFCCVMSIMQVLAQTQNAESQSILELSLEDAQQYAFENNRSLQNASLEVRQANAVRWQTIATMLPQVSASLDYSNMLGYKMDLRGLQISMPPSGTIGVTASIALSGSQIMGVLLNNIAIEMSSISEKKSELDLKYNTSYIYMSILAMEETVGLLDSNLVNLKNLYDITLNSVHVGVAEETDADQIAVQVSSMESTINSTKRSLEVLYNSLALQLGCGVGSRLVLTQTLDDLLNAESMIALLNTEFDLNRNYDYQLLKKNTDLSKKQITMAAMDYVPSIGAFYQYSGKKYFSDEETMNMTPPNAVGVTLNVPIWSSGQRASTITEKKLAYQAAQNTMADTEDQLEVQNRQLRFNLASAYENYTTQKKNIDVSQRVFENISNKFEFGYASSLEVTNASTALITAQNNYVQAMLEMVYAHIELKKLLNE